MKVDMYGSRPFLMNLLNQRDKLSIEINSAFIGTTYDSQMGKALKIENGLIKRFLNEYEQLELLTDSRKLFRRLQETSESKVIFLDFMFEGRPSIKINGGVLVNNVSLKRFIPNIEEAVELSVDKKIKELDSITDNFIKYLETYDLVIINKLRQPKYKKTVDGIEIKSNIDEVNFQNFYTESFEDLLIKKMDNIKVIEEFDISKNLVEGYYYNRDYVDYFVNSTKLILDDFSTVWN